MKKEFTGKSRVNQKEMREALEFLDRDPRGKRLKAAEYSLVLLIKGHLPRIRQYVFNATYDLREIVNPEIFESINTSNLKLRNLIENTKSTAFIKVSLEKDQIKFLLFHEKDISKNQSLLLSQSLGEVIAVTYAALGLDMTGLVSLDIEGMKKEAL